MAVKIKLKRLGKMRHPQYRIVVADSRTKRDGRAIEEIGVYRPKEDPSFIQVDADRVAYWLGVGAQPTESVTAILKVTGDWQKFKDLPAPPPMKVAEPRPDRKALYEAAAKDALEAPKDGATTPKTKKAPAAKAPEVAVDTPAAEVVEAPVEAVETPATEVAAEPVVEVAAADSTEQA